MGNLEEIKKRFSRNSLPVRLGCIASNLARMGSFARMKNNRDVIEDLVEESKFFIEWTVPKASSNIQEKLIDLQLKLALLKYNKKAEIIKLAESWSGKLIKLSGLS